MGLTKDKVEDYCIPEEGRLHCACSKSVVTKTGTGTTTQRHFKKQFYFLQQFGDDEFGMWKVNVNHVPVGAKSTVSLKEVMADYHPEVEYYQNKIAPALRKLCKHIARGDKHRRNQQPFSAEMEYQSALAIDEENVRATFGLGLTYLTFGESDKGQAVFKNLVRLDGAFDPEHKHLFNEFGIQLRKNKLYDEAAQYYQRALDISDEDENLHFNLARSRFETGRWLECLDQLCHTLGVNGQHREGRDFCRYLLKLLRQDGTRIREELAPSLADRIASRLGKVLEEGAPALAGPLKDLGGVVHQALTEFQAREAAAEAELKAEREAEREAARQAAEFEERLVAEDSEADDVEDDAEEETEADDAEEDAEDDADSDVDDAPDTPAAPGRKPGSKPARKPKPGAVVDPD